MQPSDSPGQGTNPYQSPTDSIDFVEATPQERVPMREASPRSIAAMRATHPWVKMFGVMALVLAAIRGITAVSGLLSLADDHGQDAVIRLGSTVLLAVYFGVTGVLMLRYSSSINDVLTSGLAQHLDDALDAQTFLWRFMGMTTALLLILVFGGIVFLAAFAGFHAIF
jgi:hypothetical protein